MNEKQNEINHKRLELQKCMNLLMAMFERDNSVKIDTIASYMSDEESPRVIIFLEDGWDKKHDE